MEHESPNYVEPVPEHGMRQAYQLVEDQVQQLLKARHELDAKLAKAQEAQNLLRQFLSGPEPAASKAKPHRIVGKAAKKKRFRKGSQTAEVVARSKVILKEAGKPLERGELLERIAASGFEITTTDPSRFIGRTLWESDDFIHIDKEGYWLADEDQPGKS
ncbi:hypothetical protein [Rhizobium sp. M1]|uniref:hypothetical protein n=1 Tax=Rhizobium sp. M1 TaxID=2035453 RepID=UPI001141807B|nr:hypothetical protein [Rhizobium sp. M1]